MILWGPTAVWWLGSTEGAYSNPNTHSWVTMEEAGRRENEKQRRRGRWEIMGWTGEGREERIKGHFCIPITNTWIGHWFTVHVLVKWPASKCQFSVWNKYSNCMLLRPSTVLSYADSSRSILVAVCWRVLCTLAVWRRLGVARHLVQSSTYMKEQTTSFFHSTGVRKLMQRQQPSYPSEV